MVDGISCLSVLTQSDVSAGDGGEKGQRSHTDTNISSRKSVSSGPFLFTLQVNWIETLTAEEFFICSHFTCLCGCLIVNGDNMLYNVSVCVCVLHFALHTGNLENK